MFTDRREFLGRMAVSGMALKNSTAPNLDVILGLDRSARPLKVGEKTGRT
jgi:hypothetical protein